MTAPQIPTIDQEQKWLGRLYAPDPRDTNHPMSRALKGVPRSLLKTRSQAPAKADPTLDQGPTPHCTMYGLAHCFGASPLRYGNNPLSILQKPLDGYSDCYAWAQANDEWPGENYEGTSCRAALSYALKLGRITEYVWASSIEEAKDYIKRVGSAPIYAGFDWWSGMSTPRLDKGRYIAEPTGVLEGGHAFCVLWYSTTLGLWKCQQSWGPCPAGTPEPWGDEDGIFYIPDESFQYLAFQANGELASFIENPS